MCYNAQMSGAFFLTGIAVTIYIVLFNQTLTERHVPMLLLFYSAMELLQTIQYSYVNQCGDRVNAVLTEIAYVLVIVQPLLWNVFFYLNSAAFPCDQRLFVLGGTFAVVWICVNVLARLRHSMTPTAEPQTKSHSFFAGESTCTRKRNSHLYWEWTSDNFKDLTANYLMYLMIWFIPPLLTQAHRLPILLVAAFALLGAGMAWYAGEPEIFASAWCYVSVPMVLVFMFAYA